jgi:hypothetical protein
VLSPAFGKIGPARAALASLDACCVLPRRLGLQRAFAEPLDDEPRHGTDGGQIRGATADFLTFEPIRA